MTDIDLLVDGERVDLIDTIRLLQRDPYPGGHRYRLILSGRALTVYNRFEAQNSVSERPLDPAAIFFAIESIAAGMSGEGQIPPRFILNTVDEVIRDGDQVSVQGVCSLPIH
ncbi:hypothetical protein BJ993_004106 [Nocardioides aromaticivorans]|uniref:Uncharacterized protein n=1 Tax=Nocardioides aromaticivorans TaxID=200618 RepID=A0A7Z0CMQ0_9ACTN|nr:hypothetical protein [Nocardioides aromaticivorans]NYI47026.1 hypothetical protein [Nocardioides aromaticivorans]